MQVHRKNRRRGLAVSFLITLFAAVVFAAASTDTAPQRELPPGSPALIQPEQLVAALKGSAKPAVLYVGPKFLYAQAHISGAEFIGPAADAESLDRLRKRAAALRKTSAVVLYCGCCPWEHCPNIRPAYKELQKLGFRNVKALYLADSFGTDWAEKGYPVEKGEARQ